MWQCGKFHAKHEFAMPCDLHDVWTDRFFTCQRANFFAKELTPSQLFINFFESGPLLVSTPNRNRKMTASSSSSSSSSTLAYAAAMAAPTAALLAAGISEETAAEWRAADTFHSPEVTAYNSAVKAAEEVFFSTTET